MTDAKPDYYELLGVDRDADAETIRDAFHAAASNFDPDGTAESAELAARFREVSEAYRVLSNPELRRLYDDRGYRGRPSAVDETVVESAATTPRGEDVYQELQVPSHEAASGTSRVIRFTAVENCPECGGVGIVGEPDPNCPICGGTGRPLRVSGGVPEELEELDTETCLLCSPEPCRACGESGLVEAEREVHVRVPAGVRDGEQLRIPGEGNAGTPGGLPGDLVVGVTALSEPRDPRLVRYVSLLLFLAAAAVLFIYLHG